MEYRANSLHTHVEEETTPMITSHENAIYSEDDFILLLIDQCYTDTSLHISDAELSVEAEWE